MSDHATHGPLTEEILAGRSRDCIACDQTFGWVEGFRLNIISVKHLSRAAKRKVGQVVDYDTHLPRICPSCLSSGSVLDRMVNVYGHDKSRA